MIGRPGISKIQQIVLYQTSFSLITWRYKRFLLRHCQNFFFEMSINYTGLLLRAVYFNNNTFLFNLTHKLIIFNSQKGY